MTGQETDATGVCDARGSSGGCDVSRQLLQHLLGAVVVLQLFNVCVEKLQDFLGYRSVNNEMMNRQVPVQSLQKKERVVHIGGDSLQNVAHRLTGYRVSREEQTRNRKLVQHQHGRAVLVKNVFGFTKATQGFVGTNSAWYQAPVIQRL